jgi:putative phosphoesterase
MLNQFQNQQKMQVGVISDTHGLMRPEAIAALQGVDLILHAGDIGSQNVLDALGELAPVVAIRGNNDDEPWAAGIPEEETVQIGGISVHLIHDAKQLNFVPQKAGIQIVVSGHSHKPGVRELNGVIFLNPGSAGPRRFKLPITVAQLQVESEKFSAEIIDLPV